MPLIVWILFAALQAAPPAQKPPVRNPLARDQAAIEAGAKAFEGRCAFCHGTDAKGTGRGSNLTTGHWAHGGKDGELFKTIKEGVAGTEMPPHDLPDTGIWQLVSYVRSLGGSGNQAPVPGNAAAGEKLFFGKGGCAACHMIAGRGSPFGPELSRIGARRSAASIRKSILDPSTEIAEGFTGVRLVLRSGEKLEGVIRNEDNFSIQLIDKDGRFRLLDKQQVSTLTRLEKESLMPAGAGRALAPEELQDLLAFLDRQRPPEEEGSEQR